MPLQFLDKSRQKAREHQLKEKAKEAEAKLQQPSVKPQRQPDALSTAAKRVPAAKRRKLEDRQDVSDFASDYALLKKLKKGKLSEVWFLLSCCITDDLPICKLLTSCFLKSACMSC